MKIANSTNKIHNFRLLESYSNKRTDCERETKEKNECQISLSKLKLEVEKKISNKDKLNDFYSKLNKGLDLRTSDWPISEYSVLGKSLERLTELNGQIGHIIVKNEEIDKQIDNFKILGNKLKQLNLLGLEVINEKSTDICPLCHTKHESFNNLIGSIEKDLFLSDNETALLSVKRDNLKRIDIYRNNLAELNRKVIVECKKIVTEEVNNINGLEIQIKKLENKIMHLEIDIGMLNKEINNMNQICDLENLNIEASDLFKQIKEKTEKHNLEKDIYISEKNDIFVVLEKNNLKIGEIQNRILELQNKVTTIEKKSENLTNSDSMKQYHNLLRELDLSSFEEIEEVIRGNNLTIKYREIAIHKKEKEVEHLINQIENISNEELVLKISLFEKDINALSREIETTEQTFLKLLKGEKISVENFNKKKNIYLKDLEQLNHDLILISGLTEISSNFINGTMYFKKKKILEQKLSRENATTILLTSIEDERSNCLYSIEIEIKERLNLEFINKIFSMIEPHPEYKSILFKLTEEKEQLGLNILCENSQDNVDPPTLYLSSAQVNVLSLSVFLATAVYGDSKIDTVVMDDPIQHLDNLNELSFIDILRVISNSLNKQIIITTHDETFFNLCRRKINSEFNSSKFIDLPKLLNY